jgi:hypothetical protein
VRRIVTVGRALESVVGTVDTGRVRALSAEALAARSSVDLLRRGALGAFARLLFDEEPRVRSVPYPAGEDALIRGKTAEILALPAPATLAERFHLASLLLRAGHPEAAAAHFADLDGLRGPVALGARSMKAGLHLSKGEWADAERTATVQLRRARRHRMAFNVADAAISVATARAMTGRPWRPTLRGAARSIRGCVDGGAALNLLKARWGELAAAEG